MQYQPLYNDLANAPQLPHFSISCMTQIRYSQAWTVLACKFIAVQWMAVNFRKHYISFILIYKYFSILSCCSFYEAGRRGLVICILSFIFHFVELILVLFSAAEIIYIRIFQTNQPSGFATWYPNNQIVLLLGKCSNICKYKYLILSLLYNQQLNKIIEKLGYPERCHNHCFYF